MPLKHEYDGLLNHMAHRRGEAETFLQFLEDNTNWLSCPASVHHHLNVEGGLIAHSVLVARTLFKLSDAVQSGHSRESLAMVALFHDVGKLGTPENPWILTRQTPNGPEFSISDKPIAMAQGVASLYLCARHLTLTDEEAQAICYHDGQYVPENAAVQNRETPLLLLLHMADLWSSHVIERSDPNELIASLQR